MATRKHGKAIGEGIIALCDQRTQRQSDRERNKEKIFKGTHFERWNRVKGDLNFALTISLQDFCLTDQYTYEGLMDTSFISNIEFRRQIANER